MFGKEARSFLKELGQRVKSPSGDPMAHRYLVQRISVAVQMKHCCSAREHWTEGRGYLGGGGCYYGGF